MNYLLDTHTVIWFITDNSNLPLTVKSEIENLDNKCFVSTASLWELSIKFSLKKLALKQSLKEIFEIIERSQINSLLITTPHILQSASFPFHHRDPFDRLIIAQAMVEKFTINTKDQNFSPYKAPVLWA